MQPRRPLSRLVVADVLGTANPLPQAILLGLLGAIAVGVAGAPYWRDHPFAAVIVVLDCGALAVAGSVLASAAPTRRTGLLLIGATFAWCVNWLTARNTGIFPLIGNWGSALYFTLLGIGVLLYPTGRLQNAAAKIWSIAAVVVLLGTQLLLTLFSEPEWNGFTASAIWPTLYADRSLFDLIVRFTTVMYLLLAAAYAVTLLIQFRTSRGFTRLRIAPLVAGVGLLGLISALAQQNGAMTDVQAAMEAYVIQGTAALLVPLALLGTSIVDRLRSAVITSRLLPQVSPASEEKVQEALRRSLRDDSLTLYFWSVAHQVFVDPYGRTAVEIGVGDPAEAPSGRLWIAVSDTDGEPLALIDFEADLRNHPQHVGAAVTAVRPALENARLQAELRTQLEQTRAAQDAVRTAEAQTRHRIQRDLHDGIQGNISALVILMELAREQATDERLRQLLDNGLVQAAELNEDIKTYIRGGVPTVLSEQGLLAAIRAFVARLEISIDLNIVAERFNQERETALYFCLKEGIQNAIRHAGAEHISVRVGADESSITATVEDDGTGGAAFTKHGGLSGLRERIVELGGTLVVRGSDHGGTTLAVRLPRT
jgi:signal transduction histidine kinase